MGNDKLKIGECVCVKYMPRELTLRKQYLIFIEVDSKYYIQSDYGKYVWISKDKLFIIGYTD